MTTIAETVIERALEDFSPQHFLRTSCGVGCEINYYGEEFFEKYTFEDGSCIDDYNGDLYVDGNFYAYPE